MHDEKPNRLKDRDYLINKQFPDRTYLVDNILMPRQGSLSKEVLARLDEMNRLATEIIGKIRPKREGPYVRAIKYDPIQKKVIKIINPAEPLIVHE
jgi:hypothetical protein